MGIELPPAPTGIDFGEITVKAPSLKTNTFPIISISENTNSNWFPFISGNGTSTLILDAPNGFRYLPTSSLFFRVDATAGFSNLGNVQSTVTISPVVITVSPALTNPLSILNYVPFNYSFSIPDTVIDVTLSSNGTSSSLIPYIATDGSSFSSDIGFTSALSNALFSLAPVIGNDSVGSSVTSTISSALSVITMTPDVPSRSLSLFLYEPFSFVFTTNPESIGLSLQFLRSSSVIASYCTLSSNATTLTYSGSYLSTSSSVLSLVVDLMYAGSIVPGSTITILITIGKGRFFPPASNQNFQLFQYENISTTFGSNPSFITILPIDSIIASPSLPSGLSLAGTDSNTWFMQGTPALQSTQSNYTIFGSNSSNGRIVSVPISIKVNPQQVRITPSSLSTTGMVVGTMITPVTFVATEPIVVSRIGFLWTWDTLPDGIGFYDMNGNPIPYGYSLSNTIQLMGTPTLSAANTLAALNQPTYSVRLTGTQQQGGGINVTGSSLLTFSFAETVLFSTVTIPSLYATENLGYKNVTFTAATYFASGSAITSIVAPSLPTGLSLSSIVITGTSPNLRYSVALVGTPTVVDESGTAYAFTATNANGTTRTQSFAIPILPDIVSFTTAPAENTAFSYIVSKQIDPIPFSAVSSANKNITAWALSLSTASYGLSLSASSGTTVVLSGTPTNPLAQTSVTISATDSLGTSVVRTILITIVNDTFTWPTFAPTFIQNKPIDTYQFQVTTTSGRQIQSYSATGLPAGITLSPGGVLSGTPTGSTSGSFIVSATTGFVSPPTGSQPFSYTIIPDNVLTLLTVSPTPVSFTGTSFSIANVFTAFSYSGFTASNAIQSDSVSPETDPPATFTLVGTVLSGTIPVYEPAFTFTVNGIYGSVTSSVTASLALIESPLSGSLTLSVSPGALIFTEPTQTAYALYQYCPMPSIPFRVTGGAGYIYYYSLSSNLPIGMTFTTETTGTSSTLTGIPANYTTNPVGVTVYAANGANVTFTSVNFRILAPSFINPQIGAAAFTAMLRSDVEGNAAQNARDNRVFPQVNPLAGPLMAPRAPDVITLSNCFLGLCKKPCPTCRTMM
jgi:large repetitive protein